MGFLSGKRILITGVASKLSIAYGIAQAMHREGAELAFTYQNEKLKGRVEEFAAALGSDIVLPCDVAEDESITALFTELEKVWPKFDGFVHSIGFAPADQLDGDYVDVVTRDGFKIAHVCLLEQGKYNRIVGMKGEELVDYPVDEALEMTKSIDPVLVDVCNTISI